MMCIALGILAAHLSPHLRRFTNFPQEDFNTNQSSLHMMAINKEKMVRTQDYFSEVFWGAANS
jgi:hypothetical protein